MEAKTREMDPPKPLRFLQKIEKPIPRPATPSVPATPEEEEDQELSVIYLQQIIRGRAIQNMVTSYYQIIILCTCKIVQHTLVSHHSTNYLHKYVVCDFIYSILEQYLKLHVGYFIERHAVILIVCVRVDV